MWLFSLLFSFAVSSENAGHLVPDLKLGCTNIHTVKEGDICDRIWKEYNLKDLNELLALNSGLDCANLFENQHICVDGKFKLPNCAKRYYIREDDDCDKIAKLHDLSLQEFADMNPHITCKDEEYVYAGQAVCVLQDDVHSPSINIVLKDPEEVPYVPNKNNTMANSTDIFELISSMFYSNTSKKLDSFEKNTIDKTEKDILESKKDQKEKEAKKDLTKEYTEKEEEPSQEEPKGKSTEKSVQPTHRKHPAHHTHEHRQALDAHNIERASMGIPPLRWSHSLSHQSRQYAFDLAQNCHLIHGSSGENLYLIRGDATVADAVQAWIDEKYDWTYGISEHNHYTQVMWDSTRHVGCAREQVDGCTVVVCRYAPFGNTLGQEPW